MRIGARLPAGLVLAATLSACASVGRMQTAVSGFDQGAHSVSLTQMSFLRNVQAVDCQAQFYQDAYLYASGRAANFDISGRRQPSLVTAEAVATRQAALDAVVLYADRLQTLAGRDAGKSLDADGQAMASHLRALVNPVPGSAGAVKIGAGVEAAVLAITDMVQDQKRFRDARTAASAVQSSIDRIVEALKAENLLLAAGVRSKFGVLGATLRPVIAASHASRGEMSFFDIVQARDILRSADVFGPETLAGPGDDPAPNAGELNRSLDALSAANRAIATARPEGAAASAANLVARAEAAQAVQAALSR